MRAREVVMAVVAVPLLVVLAVLFSPRSNPGVSATPESPHLTAATLPLVSKPPKSEFTRVMFAATTIKAVDKKLDKCRGPVAVSLGEFHPILVAEHDYCGGSAWISRLKVGEAVSLSGPGVDEGLYVATELKSVPRDGNATVRDLPEADVVLQTCISKTKMVLVGLATFHTEQDL